MYPVSFEADHVQESSVSYTFTILVITCVDQRLAGSQGSLTSCVTATQRCVHCQGLLQERHRC